MKIIEMWLRVTATRYTRGLEAEVARLRAENRALLNSILGIAGVPPITVETALAGVANAEDESKKNRSSLRSLGMTTKSEKPGAQVAPMRRRSWQQINRALEFASARKKERPGAAAPGNMPGAAGGGSVRESC